MTYLTTDAAEMPEDEARKLAAIGVLGKGGYDEFVAPWVDALQASREEIRLVNRQLQAVDDALGPWESEPGSEVGAVGRVQTILNLKADREETRRLREALEQKREWNLGAVKDAQEFGDSTAEIRHQARADVLGEVLLALASPAPERTIPPPPVPGDLLFKFDNGKVFYRISDGTESNAGWTLYEFPPAPDTEAQEGRCAKYDVPLQPRPSTRKDES